MSDEKETKVADTTEETAAQEVAEETKEEKKEEAKIEEKAEEKASDVDESIEVPEQFKALIDQVEKMSVLELHELVKVLEKDSEYQLQLWLSLLRPVELMLPPKNNQSLPLS